MRTIKRVAVESVLSALILNWTSLQAAVLHVPADYGRIQSAIDAAKNADVILVSPGVYNESISFKGKAITVASTNTADPNVVKSTILHASGRSSVVSFISGESSNSVLAGFTITGGYGTANPAIGSGLYFGGGIYCLGSSPTIIGNIIVSNAAPPGGASPIGYGGGIACIQSDATVTRNLLAANAAFSGGGLANYLGNARFTSNLICSNSAAAAGGGAGMMTGGRFINNTVFGNAAPDAGNVYVNSDGRGQCVVADNIICNAKSGGGLHVDGQVLFTQISFNDIWNNAGGNYVGVPDLTGVDGNISQDPQFVGATNNDFHLQDVSPCINAADRKIMPLDGELDYYGDPRLYAGRVDIGASEYRDSFRPVVEAGPDQLNTVTALPALIALDGSASSDPHGAALSYHWSQLSGPTITLNDAGTAKPAFNAAALGTYVFQLVVSNANFGSFPDIVQVTVTNAPPIAAGVSQVYSPGAAYITLDGSLSADPEGMPLSYRWTQVSGWNVQLSNPQAMNPSVTQPWPGTYVFQLVVNDGIHDSRPASVRITIGSNHAPVAIAGPSLYVLTNSVALDGTGSYDSDGYNRLAYAWRQVSGPTVTMTGTNTATPVVSGFRPTSAIQKCVFQLVVSDGSLTSTPSPVTVTIVPNYGTNTLYLQNPPFDATRPTIVAFGGGDCSTGSGMTFGGVWDSGANWITMPAYGTAYNTYGDMLMVYLSSVAPNYQKPIQAIGFSTGNRPAMQAAWYVNSTYKDARYAVNRVSLCDAVCNDLSSMVTSFQANPVAGEQAWVDNYISNDPAYNLASYITGALNVTCTPARAHSYPVNTYTGSSLDYQNGGLTAFGYLSVIGSGRNYQLKASANKYYFAVNSTGAIVFVNPSAYPGKILAPVQLAGPGDGVSLSPTGAVFNCQPVENAVRYQLLFGYDPNRVMDFTIMSDATNPPSQLVTSLPAAKTWWTVKAYDQFGSTIYADPRLIKRPENRAPVAQAGADQVVYAGLSGTAAVTLNGANSSDPDGDPLTYSWAWIATGTVCLTNGTSPLISLPPGVYTVQLMVNDGQVDSQPAQVTVTVLRPLTASLARTNGTIAFSWGSLPGRKYQVQFTTNLLSGPWQNLGDVLTATHTDVSASDTLGSEPRRFYRVVVSP
jgi:hypothetical protein